jgi:histidyl-tRNA synthetase
MDAEQIPSENRPTVLRAIDKLDRLSADDVRMLLGPGRKDESGDFTKGANLTAAQIEALFEYLGTLVRNEDFSTLNKQLSLIEKSPVGFSGLTELEEMTKHFESAGYTKDQIKIDPAVIRGLEYYTGPVFEVELLLETPDEKGRPVRFGSVGGGGRYDGLVGRFRNDQVPATGFSIGVSRLMAALIHLGKVDAKPEPGPVVVTVFDKDRVADYQRMTKTLRDAGIRAELYLGNPRNIGNQLRYADKRGAPCVVIQGGDEKAKGEVQIKDLIEGAKAAAAIASNQEWRETRPAQFAVAEEKLVEAVRGVLARHGVR